MPVGTPIDLDNCAREPIHIPGGIPPRGVLAVVREPDLVLHQVSANAADLLGRSVDAVLGRHLSALIGAEQAARVEQAASTFGDLRQRKPLECSIEVAGRPRAFDAILHREPGGVLLVELEIAYGERPFSFPNTYQAVRSSVEELNRAATLTELYETTVQAVRHLRSCITGKSTQMSPIRAADPCCCWTRKHFGRSAPPRCQSSLRQRNRFPTWASVDVSWQAAAVASHVGEGRDALSRDSP